MTAAETPDETTVVPGGCPADAAVETIQREMTVFARRARASAGRMHPELSLVSYTLLGHLEERDGRRATDLAAHYALDKSTVSRQVSALERAGLIERRVDPDDHRVQGPASDRVRTGRPGPGHRAAAGGLPRAARRLARGGAAPFRRVSGAVQRVAGRGPGRGAGPGSGCGHVRLDEYALITPPRAARPDGPKGPTP